MDHYFSEHPESPAVSRTLPFTLPSGPVTVSSSSGVFSPDSLDRGTAVLLDHAPPPTGSNLLDLGCGWGPLALTMADLNPSATVWAIDVNERARELCRSNAQALGKTGITVVAPEGVPEDTPIDVIWSNPPIRIGKTALHELLSSWLPRLAPGGQAWLVVAKHLGAPSLLTWLTSSLGEGFDAERVGRDKGFWVIRVTKT